MKLSLTGSSMVVYLLLLGAQFVEAKYGIKISEDSISVFVQNMAGVLSFIGMVYGQYRRKDVSGFIIKK